MSTDNPRPKSTLYASILAGGIGSRFWPLSRETTPKQLLNVAGEESLLQSTIKRLDSLIGPERISIVTNAQQAEIIRHHLGYKKSEPSPGYVVEPMGRNTAPAIGLAAIRLIEKDPEAVMAVLPADHLIKDGAPFRAALKAAGTVAEAGHLVTFGVTPTCAETGYGYIKGGKEASKEVEGFKAFKVERFVEKPDLETAEGYLAEGGYFWNSGIFVWKARRILEEMRTHLPAIYSALMEIKNGADLEEAYSKMEPISIDHG
ncbi:MAG: mannose-1-phosphate guanylyltransferase, partial [Thermodesulfobacteriota bacterium]